MIRSHFVSAIALTALLSAPALAQTTTREATTNSTLTQQAPTTSTTGTPSTTGMTSSMQQGSTAPRNAATAAQQAAADQGRKPLCSDLDHKNAGKHADKSTGKAKDHSASPVHMDCIADGQATTGTSGNTASGTGSTDGAMASGTTSNSTDVNAAATKKPAKTASTTGSSK